MRQWVQENRYLSELSTGEENSTTRTPYPTPSPIPLPSWTPFWTVVPTATLTPVPTLDFTPFYENPTALQQLRATGTQVAQITQTAMAEFALGLTQTATLITATPTPLPSATPVSADMAQLSDSENIGEITLGGGEVWTYEGQANDTLTIYTVADWDTVLSLYDPEGTEIAFNDDANLPNANSQIDITLPDAGQYTIEVRSFGDSFEGAYTLVIKSVDVTATPTPTVVVTVDAGD
jgi:hypothetical protein